MKDSHHFFLSFLCPHLLVFFQTLHFNKNTKRKKNVVSWGQDDQFRHLRLVKFLWICWFMNYGNKKLVLWYCFWDQTMDTLIFVWSQSVKKDEWPQLTDGMSGDIWLGHGKGQFCHHWPMVKRRYEKTEIRYLY